MTHDELTRALEPTEEELRRLAEGGDPTLIQAIAGLTDPSSAEITRLIARRRAPSRAFPLAPVLAMAALALVVTWPQAPQYLAGDVVELSGTLALTQELSVVGEGSLHIAQADPGAWHIILDQGEATFDLDPEADWEQLHVDADQVQVRVTGTVFRVAHVDEQVTVSVLEGHVEVHWPEGATELAMDQTWTGPPPPIVLPPVEPEPLIVSAPAPDPVPALAPPPTPKPQPEPEPLDTGGEAEALAAFRVLLDLNELGSHADALAAATAFQERWPEHHLAVEARFIGLQAAAVVAPPETAIVALQAWLVDRPDDRAVQVHYLRATVARERLHDCDRALRSYGYVYTHSTGKLREQARDWQVHCLN